MIELASIRNLIVDMDGVLWLGDKALPGLVEFLDTLRRLGIRFVLATNNASRSGDEYITKLAGFGASVRAEEILTSSQATAAYLARNAPDAHVYVIGEPGLVSELKKKGLTVIAPGANDGATHVVVGWDRNLNYEKLVQACLLIRSGATFIGTNPDVTYPDARGIIPGNGAILAALRVATDVEPIIIGKPQPEMQMQAMQRMGGTADDTATLGDRLDTDILGGKRVGLTTLLVLSGVTSAEVAKASSIKADYTFADIIELGKALESVKRKT